MEELYKRLDENSISYSLSNGKIYLFSYKKCIEEILETWSEKYPEVKVKIHIYNFTSNLNFLPLILKNEGGGNITFSICGNNKNEISDSSKIEKFICNCFKNGNIVSIKGIQQGVLHSPKDDYQMFIEELEDLLSQSEKNNIECELTKNISLKNFLTEYENTKSIIDAIEELNTKGYSPPASLKNFHIDIHNETLRNVILDFLSSHIPDHELPYILSYLEMLAVVYNNL